MTLQSVHCGTVACSDVFKHPEGSRDENIILIPASSMALDTQNLLPGYLLNKVSPEKASFFFIDTSSVYAVARMR